MGAVSFGTVGGITRSSVAADWVPGVRDVLTPAVLCVALAFQIGALRWHGGVNNYAARPAGDDFLGSAAYWRHGIRYRPRYRKAP